MVFLLLLLIFITSGSGSFCYWDKSNNWYEYKNVLVLRLTNSDIRIDSKGAVFILRGKTGERRVRIIAFTKLLQQWLNVHPLKHLNSYPIWISEDTNYKNNALGLRGAEKIIEEALPKSGLANKHAR